MSEEEKKALKEVKHFNRLTRYWQQEEYEEKEIEKYISILLNLIEKQQKQIQNLKQINEEHRKLNGTLREEIKELKKEKEDILDFIED